MKRIGLLVHPGREAAVSLADAVAATLSRRGVKIWRGTGRQVEMADGLPPDLSLVIAFGGDGTILRACRAAAPLGCPVVGVDFGRLGFLAEFDPQEIDTYLPALVEGSYRIEERAMLHVALDRLGQPAVSYEVVNDGVVAHAYPSRLIETDVRIDGEPLTVYSSDAVIAASATGSTAYALAAGGPILHPESRDLLLVPVAPHLTVARALVLPSRCRVEMTLVHGEGVLSVDGQADLPMVVGDTVRVQVSAQVCRLARVRPGGHFFSTLTERLRRGQ